MKKRKFVATLLGVLTILCSVIAIEPTQQSSVRAAETSVFEMTKGGSIRIMEPTGLRFQVKMSENIKTQAEKIGMLIFPADYLVDDGTQGDVYYESIDALAQSKNKIDLDLTSKVYEENGYLYANGAIVNIKGKNMAREFVGIAYYKDKADGTIVYANSQMADTTRSAAQVALLTHADKTNKYSDKTKALLLNYMSNLKATNVDYNAPTRYQALGYAADNGLRFYVVQYVDNVVSTGDKLTEQTHLEAEILQANIGGGENSTYCKFWLDGTCEYDDASNIKNVINEVTITDRGAFFTDGYRYKISYEIFIEFNSSVGSTDEPYAYVQFKHHLPSETEDGLHYSYKEYKDENRYLWQDNCNLYEFHANGIVAKDIRYLETTATYNKELFYQNQGTIQAADPCVITVGDTFYLYATNANADGDCSYIRVWSSKNLTDWIEVGKAFVPAADAWAVSSLWAPEVIEANGKYYMYYSGYNRATNMMGIGVAVSDSPTGPFHEIEGTFGENTYSRTKQPIDLGYPIIDPNPFIDDDGSVYLYVAKDQVDGVSSIYGCKLSSDMVTVESVTTDPLITPTEGWENASAGTKWTEAPSMLKYEGKYYLTYSARYYAERYYSLGLAVSENPLSGFTKVDYNPIFMVDDSWTHVTGTGHNCFFPSPDGTELWVAYHSHIDTEKGGGERKINFDKVTFDTDGNLVISGPSVTPQVLPSGVSDYGNIASLATVSATNGGNTSLLTDGIVSYRITNINTYEYSSTGTNTITFTFEEARKIGGIMVYDSADTTAGGGQVSVTVGDNSYNMTLDSSNIPGTATILEINETEASVVTLTFTGDVNLGEIVILAKGCWTFGLTTNYFTETTEGVYTLTTDSTDESKVDDVKYGINSMKAVYYSVKGKLTLTDAQDWGQARILISSDPQNEYFIAVEKTNQNKYQIFTMSKANEGSWNEWKLILDAAVNDQRNSIDFEVIADGQKIYFLIDDEICYTSERVSMTESTVKFTGYNSATTTVENLDGQFFENSDVVQAYIATKNGDNFGVTEGDGVSYKTTSEVDLTKDFGENATIEMFGASPRYAYLNDTFTDKFYFETEINVTGALPDDYPKFGLMLNGKTEMVKFFVDMTPSMTATHVGVVHQKTGEGDDWANSVSAKVTDMKFTGSDIVKLAVVRDGVNYYFYVNGTQVLSGTDLTNEKSAVGIFSFNTVLTASNYTILKDADADSKIEQAKEEAARFFGIANGLRTREDVDLSKDTGANTGIVLVNGIGNTYLYAKNIYQAGYYFETKIHVNDVLNEDQWPKFGLFAEDGEERIHFYVDMTTDKTSSRVGVVRNYEWGTEQSVSVENMSFSATEEYVTLGLRKDGTTLRFYVNGVEVLSYASSFEGNSTVGAFGFNVGMVLKEYHIE